MLKKHIADEQGRCTTCYQRLDHLGNIIGYGQEHCWLPSDEALEMMQVLRNNGYRCYAVRHTIFVKTKRRGLYHLDFCAKIPVDEVLRLLKREERRQK